MTQLMRLNAPGTLEKSDELSDPQVQYAIIAALLESRYTEQAKELPHPKVFKDAVVQWCATLTDGKVPNELIRELYDEARFDSPFPVESRHLVIRYKLRLERGDVRESPKDSYENPARCTECHGAGYTISYDPDIGGDSVMKCRRSHNPDLIPPPPELPPVNEEIRLVFRRYMDKLEKK